MNIINVKAGDEIIVGKLCGVRFWSVSYGEAWGYPPMSLRSWQYPMSWTPDCPAESDEIPTMENGHGLNVYKTVQGAIDGSCGALETVGKNQESVPLHYRGGIVLGHVELWGCIVEHARGYRAQYVQPISFDRAWGYDPDRILREVRQSWRLK